MQSNAVQQIVEGGPAVVDPAKPLVAAVDLLRLDKNRGAIANRKSEPVLVIDEKVPGLAILSLIVGQLKRRAFRRAAQDCKGFGSHPRRHVGNIIRARHSLRRDRRSRHTRSRDEPPF